MNSKTLIIILSIGIILLSFLNYRNKENFKKEISTYKIEKEHLINKTSFLKLSYDYSLNIDKSFVSNLPVGKDIIIYFSGNSCSSCVEFLMKDIKDLEQIQKRALIISDNKVKNELTPIFNDAYSTNFSHQVDTTAYFKELINDVLVIKIVNNKIASLLVYKPEEKTLFDEYFYPID